MPCTLTLSPHHNHDFTARLDGFDQHVDLLMLGFTRMGWDPADFVLFRTDAPYPPIPSTLVLELPLKD